jgi:hypothetical protein
MSPTVTSDKGRRPDGGRTLLAVFGCRGFRLAGVEPDHDLRLSEGPVKRVSRGPKDAVHVHDSAELPGDLGDYA